MIKKSFIFLQERKDKINRFVVIFMISYFLLIFAPYLVALLPALNNFFMGSTTKLIYRSITTLYLVIYAIFLWIANKQKPNYIVAIGMIILLLLYLVSILFAPKSMSYVTVGNTMQLTETTFYVGWYSYITFFAAFFVDCLVFWLIVSFFPSVIKNKNQIIISLLPVIAIMIISCLFSYGYEFSKYLSLISGGSQYSISIQSFFHSKNAFGLFLFIGSVACTFVIFMTKKLRYKWFFVPLIMFGITSLLIECRTAFLCIVILILGICIYLLVKDFKTHVKRNTIILSIVFGFGMIFALFMVVPTFHSGSLENVYNFFTKVFISIGSSTFSARSNTWALVLRVVSGPFIAIGYNETNSIYEMNIISIIENGNSSISDFHSGYVSWYAAHGIIGSLIYLAIIGWIVYKIIRIIKKDLSSGLLLLVIMISCLIFMIPETYTMFVSISAYSFIINIILVIFALYEERRLYLDEKVEQVVSSIADNVAS